jgi:ankyrin repeat protein
MVNANLGHIFNVELLLQMGVNPDVPDANGLTALMISVRNGNAVAARTLLEYGASLLQIGTYGKDAIPLRIAFHVAAAAVLQLNSLVFASFLSCRPPARDRQTTRARLH